MKITVEVLRSKLRNGYSIIGEDGEITNFSSYKDIDVIYMDKDVVRVEYVSNNKKCNMDVRPVALLHPEKRHIAIDEIKEPKSTNSYKFYKVVVCDNNNNPGSVIAAYIFHRLLETFGKYVVKLESLNWVNWRNSNYSQTFLKDTNKDTYIITIGNDSTRFYGKLDSDLNVNIRNMSNILPTVSKVIKALHKLGADPIKDIESDTLRLANLANGIMDRDKSLEHYVFKLMTEIKPCGLDSEIKINTSLFNVALSISNYFKVDDTSVDVFKTHNYTDAANTDIAKLCKNGHATLWEYICAKYLLAEVYACDKDSTDPIYLKSIWTNQSTIGTYAYRIHADVYNGAKAIPEYRGKNIVYLDKPRAYIYTFKNSKDTLGLTVDHLASKEGIENFTIEEPKYK